MAARNNAVKSEKQKSGSSAGTAVEIFDIVFILILCYISLLLPIIIRGQVIVRVQ